MLPQDAFALRADAVAGRLSLPGASSPELHSWDAVSQPAANGGLAKANSPGHAFRAHWQELELDHRCVKSDP